MILHIDMDAFFASIEQRDNPALRNKPIVVSGNFERSVVSTASYEARKFGIHSAMPVFQAKQKCRELIIVPGNMKKYKSDSIKIMDILSGFSPLVEPVSIDEAYMDITGCERLFGPVEKIGHAIKNQIERQLSLTSSIGIAPVKFLSKIASGMNKPDGLTIITHVQVPDFLLSLPIEKVPGVGHSTMKQMDSMNIRYLGDIKKFPPLILSQKFGKLGARLLELASGMDHSKVETGHERKSISSETTLPKDIIDFETVKNILLDRSQTVGRDLRRKNLLCETVFIKIKFSDFSQVTRSRTLMGPVCSSTAIFNEALALFSKLDVKKKIRLVGVGVSSLKGVDTPVQMSLIAEEVRPEKQWMTVDKTVDSIMNKFGSKIIRKASLNEQSD